MIRHLLQCCCFLLLASLGLVADEFRPALLEVAEREGGWVDVTWKVPEVSGKAVEVNEAAATDLGLSTITGTLKVTSTGTITDSGKLTGTTLTSVKPQLTAS